MSADPVRSVCSHAGCSLSYFVEGDGPPVLLIQGTAVGGTGWQPQVEALRGQYACACFDNRGYGQSQPGSKELSLEMMAADALAVMDALGWESAHLVGHSLGGLIAQYVARHARQRVRSLSLLCTFPSGAIPMRLDPRLLWVGARTRLGTRRMRRRAFLELVLSPGDHSEAEKDALADRLSELFGHDIGDSPPVAMQQLGAMRRADATPFLAGLAGIPTLVVSGTHDLIAPPSGGRALAGAIPGARYVELPDGAHGLVVEHADRVNALLLEHLGFASAHLRPE